MTKYTTVDGKPLAWPQSGITLVHTPLGTYLLYLDGVFIGPPPSDLPGNQ